MDKKTRATTAGPSAHAAGDEAARLFGEEPAGNTDVPSSYAARLFGEEAADNYGVMGRLMIIDRLPVGDLGLLTVGFRITDRPYEKWTRRFNQFKYGEPAAAKAAIRTFCAAFEDFLPAGNPRIVVVSSVSSGQNIVQHDTPASKLASALALFPRLGVAPASRYEGSASQDQRPRLRGRAGRRRGRGVPGCPHRRRARPGDRRRRLLHPGRDARRHRPRGPGVQPRMEGSGGQPRQGRARRLLERRADQRTHPRLAGCHLALGPGRVALPLNRNKGCIHMARRPRPYTPQTQKEPHTLPCRGWTPP